MIPLIISYVLNVIDYLFTAHWIRIYGLEIEANPIARWMFEHDIAGVIKIGAIGIIYAIMGYIVYRYPKYTWMTYPLFLFYAGIVIYHIFLTIFVL